MLKCCATCAPIQAMDDHDEERAKARALRRYEAAPLAFGSDPAAPQMEFFSPFGPFISRTGMQAALVDHLNRYIDTQVVPGQPGEFHLPADIVTRGADGSLLRYTETQIARFVAASTGAAPRRVRVDIFWAVSQPPGTASPVHFHSADISGVMYLKTPEVEQANSEEEKTYISNRQAGFINFMIGGRQEFSRSIVSFKPVVGQCYIFPGWLLHGAEPFRGRGERRSLAFNARVGLD